MLLLQVKKSVNPAHDKIDNKNTEYQIDDENNRSLHRNIS